MCLSTIGRIVAMDSDGEAVVELAGRLVRASLAPILLEGGVVAIGDRVLLHTGLAVGVVGERDEGSVL